MKKGPDNRQLELHLRAIDVLQARLELDDLDRKAIQGLKRRIAAIKRSFAAHFIDGCISLEFVWRDRSVDVWPYWLVSGQPKKSKREQARIWMEERGYAWDGSVQGLREAIRKALDDGAGIPDGFFGIHVERTVQIRIRNEIASHLEPEHTYLNARIPPFIWIKRWMDKDDAETGLKPGSASEPVVNHDEPRALTNALNGPR